VPRSAWPPLRNGSKDAAPYQLDLSYFPHFRAGAWCADHMHPPLPLLLDYRLLVYAWSSGPLGLSVAVVLHPQHDRASARTFYEVLIVNRATRAVVEAIRFDMPEPCIADCPEVRARALKTAYQAACELVRAERQEAERRRRRKTGAPTREETRWLRKQLTTLTVPPPSAPGGAT
jgi:hypothetical protein